MIRKKLIVPIVLIVCCLLLYRSIGNTAENVTEIGVNILKGPIDGICFNDVNQDGQINEGEQGIPGVTVTLRRFYFIGFCFKDVASIETDAEGKYIFFVNRAGIYQIEESDPPGSTSTTPNIVTFFIGFFKPDQIINFGDLLGKPSVSIYANPQIIQKGQFSKLSWSASNADSVFIDQGLGHVPLDGELTVFPQQTTTYTITAIGAGGTSQSSVTVIVQETVTTSTTIPNPPPTTTSTALVTTSTQPTTTTSVSTTTTSQPTTTTTQPTTTTSVRPTTTTSVLPTTTTTTQPTTTTTQPTTTTTQPTTTTSQPTTTTTQPTTSSVKSTTTTSQVFTVIALASFTGIPGNREVMLVWVTESEIENAGFNIYRAETEDGIYVRLSASLIPAQGTATSGATYTYADRDVVNRRTYFYKLEDIDVNGVATSHGPVSATPLFIYGIK